MLLRELLQLAESAGSVPKVGDECKADYTEEGDYSYGKITKIGSGTEDGMTWAKLEGEPNFCGDTPTRKDDNGVWVFDGF